MTTPAAILLPLVGALNDPAEPFSFAVTGTTIVGQWDCLHARYPEHGAAGRDDETYRITVEINEKKSTYDVAELTTGSVPAENAATATGGDRRLWGRSFGLRAAGGHPASLASSRYTEPLFVFLEGNGYSRRRGLPGRLFTR